MTEYNVTKPRRRSNSQNSPLEMKTKFEINEAEPVFEEDIHGPPPKTDDDENGEALSTSSTNESHNELPESTIAPRGSYSN